ncbi:hypothetical protein [Spirillospora sp. CA-294931]|uniref:hypothetical protein n=1 Tax=Spirillospora sp. CA-294931 TaxID=3240042 RepID=UPI003D95029C
MAWGPPGQPSPLGQPTWPGNAPQPHWQPPPPADDPPDGDPFTRAEHQTRAAVTSPWWATATPEQRRQTLLPYLLTLPDHSWWLHAAWTRWYRWHPADSRWFPTPPPRDPTIRDTAQPGTTPPAIPAELLPTGPDYTQEHHPPLAVVGTPLTGALLYRLRSVISEAAQAPLTDYPLTSWTHFLHGTPSTIAATWHTMLWCADVPTFDPALETLDLWQPHLAPTGAAEGPLHWHTAPPLHTLIGLYADRLRAARPDTANQIIRCMVMTAQALRGDPRFRLRASALLSMIEPIQANPAIDHPALPYGDQALEHQWRERCPAPLHPTLFADTAPGEHLQLAFYDLIAAAASLSDDVEPRHVATALLAGDLSHHRPDLVVPIGQWLDPELRALLHEVLDGAEHPLRALWTAFPKTVEATVAVLSATAAVGHAWTRLTGTCVPGDGFPMPGAYATHLHKLKARKPEPTTREDPAPAPEAQS